ncbi:Na+/H+ antiporter subunit C [Alphaproteobacteria bacterium GH1-50]|uniref:Na+/H+ antiporter subunit C n=1 Tax=Kangsaoukella pontilimi TaxID=2691042 RepID=A0A7C9MSN2_9RHOB|nr:Na+/H+ antiporter subunit C [Kangsaoukella pontilimi]MXQ09457.1 Na+/H+ antiporter subunit C [Kangsaoukella pontilimi]
MEVVLSCLVGVLSAAAIYLMLSRDLLRFLFGLILISNAANLAIFTSGRLITGNPPLILEGQDFPVDEAANALPQALVLTAIVIGFGLFAFALTLTLKAYRRLGTLDTSEMRVAEPREE